MEFKPGKIAIVGAGRVGISTAVSILLNNVASHLWILDNNEDKLKAHVTDLKAAEEYYDRCKIVGTTSKSQRHCIGLHWIIRTASRSEV